MIISAMWQELTIAYALNHPKTEELAADLFYVLARRDFILSIGDVHSYEHHQKQITIN